MQKWGEISNEKMEANKVESLTKFNTKKLSFFSFIHVGKSTVNKGTKGEVEIVVVKENRSRTACAIYQLFTYNLLKWRTNEHIVDIKTNAILSILTWRDLLVNDVEIDNKFMNFHEPKIPWFLKTNKVRFFSGEPIEIETN